MGFRVDLKLESASFDDHLARLDRSAAPLRAASESRPSLRLFLGTVTQIDLQHSSESSSPHCVFLATSILLSIISFKLARSAAAALLRASRPNLFNKFIGTQASYPSAQIPHESLAPLVPLTEAQPEAGSSSESESPPCTHPAAFVALNLDRLPAVRNPTGSIPAGDTPTEKAA